MAVRSPHGPWAWHGATRTPSPHTKSENPHRFLAAPLQSRSARSTEDLAICGDVFGDFRVLRRDVASHHSRRVERPRVPRRPSRRPSRAVDRWIPLSLSILFPGAAGRRGPGAGRARRRGARARGGPGVRRVEFHCLDYNFVRVSVISLQSAPWAARQTTQESAPAGGACSSGTSRWREDPCAWLHCATYLGRREVGECRAHGHSSTPRRPKPGCRAWKTDPCSL
jgi:hypothetical protein